MNEYVPVVEKLSRYHESKNKAVLACWTLWPLEIHGQPFVWLLRHGWIEPQGEGWRVKRGTGGDRS